MKRSFALLLILAAATACTKAVPKVATEPPPRHAIEIQYVAVPTINVYAQPRADAPVVTQYGINETVSILKRQGEWVELRTVDGSGWARASELMTADQAKAIADNPVPRFLTAPVQVPDARARGEITFNAKVNTDGEIVEVNIAKNTTRNNALAVANANALMEARFYPMIQKGQRMTFTYEYKVEY